MFQMQTRREEDECTETTHSEEEAMRHRRFVPPPLGTLKVIAFVEDILRVTFTIGVLLPEKSKAKMKQKKKPYGL